MEPIPIPKYEGGGARERWGEHPITTRDKQKAEQDYRICRINRTQRV
jgi:hypothetical protein